MVRGSPTYRRLSFLLAAQRHQVTIWLYVFISFAFGAVFGRFLGVGIDRFRAMQYQNRGEVLVSRALQANFTSPDYHLLNHVTIRLSDGTTQIDHILVSRFGVYVIETKDYNGWLFASEKQRFWLQVFFDQQFRFQNPLLQNFRHVVAVRELLDFLPPECIRSAVVFTGNAEFKTEVPEGVYDLLGLIDYLRQQTQEVMSLNRMQFCVGRLEAMRLAISGATDVEHIQSLERRYGDAV